MKIEKKVKRKYFKAIIDGRKRFEVRLADFRTKPGDILVLKEQDDKTNKLTGRKMEMEIFYKMNTKEVLNFYSKKEIEKHGLLVMAVRRKFNFRNS